jgi:hypothetical protein
MFAGARTHYKKTKAFPSTAVPPLLLRELRGEVRENVGQVEDACRGHRIRWGNSSVIIPLGLNRVFMSFTKPRRSGTCASTSFADQEIGLHAVAHQLLSVFSPKKFHQRPCWRNRTAQDGKDDRQLVANHQPLRFGDTARKGAKHRTWTRCRFRMRPWCRSMPGGRRCSRRRCCGWCHCRCGGSSGC